MPEPEAFPIWAGSPTMPYGRADGLRQQALVACNLAQSALQATWQYRAAGVAPGPRHPHPTHAIV